MVTLVAAAGIQMTTEGAAGAAGTLAMGRGTTGMTGQRVVVAAAIEAEGAEAEAGAGAGAVTASGNID